MSDNSWTTSQEAGHQLWVWLVEQFYQQIRYGCQSDSCDKPSCRTCLNRVLRSYRVPVSSVAKHWATLLAEEPDALGRLCQFPMKPMDPSDGAFAMRGPQEQFHTRSMVQQLFNTQAWHQPQISWQVTQSDPSDTYSTLIAIAENGVWPLSSIVARADEMLGQMEPVSRLAAFTSLFEYSCVQLDEKLDVLHSAGSPGSDEQLLDIALLSAGILIAFMDYGSEKNFELLGLAISYGTVHSLASGSRDLLRTGQIHKSIMERHIEVVQSPSATALATRLLRALNKANLHARFFHRLKMNDATGKPLDAPHMFHWRLAMWAKLVFRNTWQAGIAEIDIGCDSELALRFLDDSRNYLCSKCPQSSYPGCIGLVAQNIEIVRDTFSWMKSSTSNSDKLHLFNLPWVFELEERLVLFRSANFSLMLNVFESAVEMTQMVNRACNIVQYAASAQERYQLILQRMRGALTTFLVLEIKREYILEDALQQLWRREQRELRRPIKIRMGMDMGEEGVDLGGVQQEFFRLAIARALDPDHGFFNIDPVTKMAWFKPYTPVPNSQFTLLGILFGLAIYNNITLPVTFPRYFYELLLLSSDETALPTHNLELLSDGWPVIYRSLKALLEYEGDDVEETFGLDHSFVVDVTGQIATLNMQQPAPESSNQVLEIVDLPTNLSAEPVTNANRETYVDLHVEWMLDRAVKPQKTAFIRGFRAAMPSKPLRLFRSAAELSHVVEGTQEISVEELRRITKYVDGYNEDSQVIRFFWEAVETYDQDQRRNLLKFVTASERIPATGYRDLNFTIQKNGTDDRRLPTSMTCFGRLLIPEYSSRHVLQERLRVALDNCEGFGTA